MIKSWIFCSIKWIKLSLDILTTLLQILTFSKYNAKKFLFNFILHYICLLSSIFLFKENCIL